MFFVNKRFIKDKTLTSAAEQAFKGLLPIGKFGFIILDLELDQRKIDVNVHPTKLEIRFQEEQKVFKAVYHAIRDSLLKADLIKNAEKEPKETTQIPIIPNIQELVSSNIPEKKNEEPVEEKHKTSEGGLFSIFKKKDNDEEIKEENENVLAQIFNKKSLEKIEEPTITKIPENIEKETINPEIEENKIEVNEKTEKIEDLIEYNCSVLLTPNGNITSEIEEIKTSKEILEYGDKFLVGEALKDSSLTRTCPAEISEKLRKEIETYSLAVFKMLNMRGTARIDFLYDTKKKLLYIDEINNNQRDYAITDSILDLVHNLGIKTVAEGIETVGQYDFLREMKCDYIQGFLMSKPLNEDDALEFVEMYDALHKPDSRILKEHEKQLANEREEREKNRSYDEGLLHSDNNLVDTVLSK